MKDHALRHILHNEVHARPPEPVVGPMAISHLVQLYGDTSKQASRVHLQQLLASHQLPMPDDETNHMSVDIGLFRLRWELHTEFGVDFGRRTRRGLHRLSNPFGWFFAHAVVGRLDHGPTPRSLGATTAGN